MLMNINGKIKEFEEENKNTIFSNFSEYIRVLDDHINALMKSLEILGQSQIDIPNLGITANNKIIELSNEFNDKGVSMFCSVLDDYNCVTSSFIGDSIMFDLIDKLDEANKKLIVLAKKVNEISYKKK